MVELSKHIKVDVFGGCGAPVPECPRDRHTECTSQLIETYKFYFAAENSLCKDYFTGKTCRFPSFGTCSEITVKIKVRGVYHF